ncbi:putative membrane protein (plasmid) [Candidatus Protochlamydia naegleriophila]|uniref:Putative membrane protein n=1 Tax=Candidatus Protochlamydia naegleriophila TaxID=389348 RepID=A0A0U5JHL7_9BACT|nr:putative membrane protein [Candidatus Protochlamydia naegleriophila]
MLNLLNGSILVASTLIFSSAITGRIFMFLEKIEIKPEKKIKRAATWLVFSMLLMLTAYFYVAYSLLLRWQ